MGKKLKPPKWCLPIAENQRTFCRWPVSEFKIYSQRSWPLLDLTPQFVFKSPESIFALCFIKKHQIRCGSFDHFPLWKAPWWVCIKLALRLLQTVLPSAPSARHDTSPKDFQVRSRRAVSKKRTSVSYVSKSPVDRSRDRETGTCSALSRAPPATGTEPSLQPPQTGPQTWTSKAEYGKACWAPSLWPDHSEGKCCLFWVNGTWVNLQPQGDALCP